MVEKSKITGQINNHAWMMDGLLAGTQSMLKIKINEKQNISLLLTTQSPVKKKTRDITVFT